MPMFAPGIGLDGMPDLPPKEASSGPDVHPRRVPFRLEFELIDAKAHRRLTSFIVGAGMHNIDQNVAS